MNPICVSGKSLEPVQCFGDQVVSVLTHNIDEDGKVNVTKDHIAKAYELLWNLLETWEYNLYVARERKLLEIGEDEWTEMLGFLTGDVLKIFSSIAEEKGIQRAVLITRLDKSARSIDGYLSELKDRNLVEHAEGEKGGYQLTERGIAVFCKIISLMAKKEEPKVELPPKEKILSVTELEKALQGKMSLLWKRGCPTLAN